jgi:hypothetical protein
MRREQDGENERERGVEEERRRFNAVYRAKCRGLRVDFLKGHSLS